MTNTHQIHKPLPKIYVRLVIGAIFVMLFESITKGWLSFFVIPALAIVLPLLLVVQVTVIRRLSRGYISQRLLQLAVLQLVFLVTFYVAVPGVGDGDDYWLFGILTAQASSPLVAIAETVTIFSFAASIVATVSAYALLAKKPRGK